MKIYVNTQILSGNLGDGWNDENEAADALGEYTEKTWMADLAPVIAEGHTVEISIDVTSINSGTPAFNTHLQSPDLFNAAKFPTMTFVSDKFVFNGDKVSEVVGNLTLLGKTQPVTLKANQFNCYESPMLKREVCGGDFEATIDRTAFGLNYGVDWGFPKNVRLVIQVEAVKQ